MTDTELHLMAQQEFRAQRGACLALVTRHDDLQELYADRAEMFTYLLKVLAAITPADEPALAPLSPDGRYQGVD